MEADIQGESVLTMNPTDHLFYLICHGFKHFLHSGFGIRQIADMVMLANRYDHQIHWAQIAKNCRMIRAEKFAAAVFRIGEKHLGLEKFPEISENEAELFSIAYGGNFGAASSGFSEGKSETVLLAAKVPELLKKGDSYTLASELAEKCKTRESLLEFFERLLNITGRCGIDRAAGRKTPVRVSPIEAVKTSEIIERGKTAVLQNCSIELIQSWFSMELSRVFGGNL